MHEPTATHHYIHLDKDILSILKNLVKGNTQIMASIQDVQNAVQAQVAIDSSVVTLLQQLTQMIKDAQASNDPAALDAVVASIEANTKVLSDAVTANTPAPPQVTPPPSGGPTGPG